MLRSTTDLQRFWFANVFAGSRRGAEDTDQGGTPVEKALPGEADCPPPRLRRRSAPRVGEMVGGATLDFKGLGSTLLRTERQSPQIDHRFFAGN
jgi:hypothetical protein